VISFFLLKERKRKLDLFASPPLSPLSWQKEKNNSTLFCFRLREKTSEARTEVAPPMRKLGKKRNLFTGEKEQGTETRKKEKIGF
jgi:hypothetical protein